MVLLVASVARDYRRFLWLPRTIVLCTTRPAATEDRPGLLRLRKHISVHNYRVVFVQKPKMAIVLTKLKGGTNRCSKRQDARMAQQARTDNTDTYGHSYGRGVIVLMFLDNKPSAAPALKVPRNVAGNIRCGMPVRNTLCSCGGTRSLFATSICVILECPSTVTLARNIS